MEAFCRCSLLNNNLAFEGDILHFGDCHNCPVCCRPLVSILIYSPFTLIISIIPLLKLLISPWSRARIILDNFAVSLIFKKSGLSHISPWFLKRARRSLDNLKRLHLGVSNIQDEWFQCGLQSCLKF